LRLHEQIFQLSYFSNGAVDVNIAYNLPVHLRNFYYKQLVDLKEQESKAYKGENSSKSTRKTRVDKPF